MFSRAREAVRKAYRRFLDSIYRGIKGYEIRSVSCRIGVKALDLDFSISEVVEDFKFALPEPHIGSETVECSVSSLTTNIEARLAEDSQPPVPDTEVTDFMVGIDPGKVREDGMAIDVSHVQSVPAAISKVLHVKDVRAVVPTAKLYSMKGVRAGEGTRVVDGQRWAAIVPMTRAASDFYRLPAEERVRLWNVLVKQADKRPNELELIGIFPGVPVRGIKRLGFDGGSKRLRIWLEAVKSKGGEDTPTRTLILARERASGKLHRVFDSG